ncbi:pre-mRNA-splicing factor CWC22 homolog [Trachinotus anak]|uniref:pre-mRNA-splicing factor CWC22 homolog n=1 Tax=Trachinotus anak TaxID=443729 RepID=UPI0039F1E623
MDSPGNSRSPSPAPREHSEDESSPVAERPQKADSVERTPKDRPSPQASPAGRSPPRSGASSSSDSSSSSSSEDEDEHNGAQRRIRSSVAQIKRSKSREQDRSKSRERDRSRSRGQDRSRSKSRERDTSRSSERDRSRGRDRSRSRGRDRSRSRGRDRSRSRSRGRDRSRSRSRSRGRDRSRSRGRNRSNSWGRDRSRSRERDRERYDRGRYARDRYDDRRDDRNGRFDRRTNRDAESDQRRRGRLASPPREGDPVAADEPPVKKKKEEVDPILTRTGGAYIPPAKLRMMQQQISDKSSLAYQRMSWEALKKSINGLINKVNVSNIVNIIQELLQENIVRGRGLLARSVLQAQAASPIFTHVYAAVVAIINSKFPQIGELILKRLILAFRRSYRRNLKQQCLTASKFVAHLINQNVAHEVLCLEMLTLLLERPTDDSVEVAIAFLKECGLKLTEVSPRGINAIFERLRNVLHESSIDKRVQYMIEVMFAIRKDGFKDHPVIPDGLDLVDEDDQFTHMLPLDDEYNTEDILNVFKMDPDFLENEEKYKTIKRDILDEGSSDSGEEGDGSDEDEEDEEDENEEGGEDEKVTIFDKTEVNLVAFRRTIYLAIQSSLDFEECAHKLIKMDFPESQTKELCNMILDCCAQQRTYEKFFGLLAGRFCLLKKEYMESFEGIFSEQYDTIHRLETNKLRNVARLFAHLLYTDSVPWSVLECIRMSEETTTSSSRIFVKILFQELCAYMGLPRLNQRLKDQTLQPFFEGLFPRDNPRNTRFAINFFTSIGLGGLTDELREHLKNAPKMIMTQNQEVESSDSDSSSSSSSSSSDSSSSDSSSESDSDSSDSDSSSSSSSSSDSDNKHRKKKKRKGQSEEKNKKKEKDKKKKKDKPTDKKRTRRRSDKDGEDDSDDEKQARKDRKGHAHEVEERERAREVEERERAREGARRSRRDERAEEEEERQKEEERRRKMDIQGRQRDGERERDRDRRRERERERPRERENDEKREREGDRERNKENRDRNREREERRRR